MIDLFEALAPYSPTLVGTFPLGIQARERSRCCLRGDELHLEGDPYRALLELETWPMERITALVRNRHDARG